MNTENAGKQPKDSTEARNNSAENLSYRVEARIFEPLPPCFGFVWCGFSLHYFNTETLFGRLLI